MWPGLLQITTKEKDYIRKELNFRRIGVEHEDGRRFIVLEYQYGCRDVRRKHSINSCKTILEGTSCRIITFLEEMELRTGAGSQLSWTLTN